MSKSVVLTKPNQFFGIFILFFFFLHNRTCCPRLTGLEKNETRDKEITGESFTLFMGGLTSAFAVVKHTRSSPFVNQPGVDVTPFFHR